jgi:hypothetical protein
MNQENEYLTKVVVNPFKKTFDLYGSEGSHRQVECDMEEFFSVLEISREMLDENDNCELVYVSPM